MRLARTIVIPLFFFLLSLDNFIQAQNNVCANASPFCTGQTMTFPATTNAPPAQAGPAYDCLFSQPNPAWFFFQAQTSGPMTIAMAANNDIDFCCWGPFPSMNNVCNSLSQNMVVDCSYSGSPTETCVITNAIPGMFYVMLITNFSNTNQNITFNQTNAGQPGAASTNCNLVCVVSPTNSGIVCEGGSVTLSLAAQTSTSVNSYTWAGPNGYFSTNSVTILNPVLSSGIYTLMGSSSAVYNNSVYTSTCQATTSVTVIPIPHYTLTPTFASICQGGSTNAAVTFTAPQFPAGYTYTWFPSSGAGIASPNGQNTSITPALLPSSVQVASYIYTVTVNPNASINCPITQTLSLVVNKPATPVLTLPGPLCDTYNPLQLLASPGGGTWSATPALTSSGWFSPNLAPSFNNPVSYSVFVGNCMVSNNANLQVSKFHTASLAQVLGNRCVQDAPYRLMKLPLDTSTGTWYGPNVSGAYFNFSGLATGNYTVMYRTVSIPNLTLCPDSSYMVIPVFNPTVPVISPISPKCDVNGTVTLNASPPNGVWTGNNGVSSNGVQTPSLCLPGNTTVNYSAGQGTCVASATATLHVSRFNTAKLSGTVQPLCEKNPSVNLMAIVQTTGGVWSGQNVLANAFTPAGLPTNTYQLIYTNFSSPDLTLCPESSTLTVSVLSPVTPTILPIGPLCIKGNSVQLNVSPTTGSFLPTNYLKTTGVFTPSLCALGNNLVQYMVGNASCNAQHSLNITIEDFVSAAVTQTLGDLCTNAGTIQLQPFTASNTGTWTGSGVSGFAFDPAASGAGIFHLVYSTASQPNGLCPDADTLTVKVHSIAIPAISGQGTVCSNTLPFQLIATPLGGIFGVTSKGPVTTEGVFHPALAAIGENLVGYTVSAGPCIAFSQMKISVEAFIPASLKKIPEMAYCVTAEPFNLQEFPVHPGGTWAGAGITNKHMFNPGSANIGENTLVYRTHSMPTPLLCPDVSTMSIKVKEQPTVVAFSNKQEGCAPLVISFNTERLPAGVGTWHFGDGGGPQAGFSLTHTFTVKGTYPVLFRYEDKEAIGCDAEYKFPMDIKVLEPPFADFIVDRDEIFTSDPTINLHNTSSLLPSNYYLWEIQDQPDNHDIHPRVTFPNAGYYKITLQATAVNGCKAEKSRIIEVKNDFSVFIPNTFSPNADGLNDLFLPVFSPFGLDEATYEMTIFDRWGHIVFFTRDHTEGWDGSAQNKSADISKQDSFNYLVKFRDLEGRVYQKTGIVVRL